MGRKKLEEEERGEKKINPRLQCRTTQKPKSTRYAAIPSVVFKHECKIVLSKEAGGVCWDLNEQRVRFDEIRCI